MPLSLARPDFEHSLVVLEIGVQLEVEPPRLTQLADSRSLIRAELDQHPSPANTELRSELEQLADPVVRVSLGREEGLARFVLAHFLGERRGVALADVGRVADDQLELAIMARARDAVASSTACRAWIPPAAFNSASWR